MKNSIFLKLFLIIFAMSFTFIACNKENSTEISTNKKIEPNGPVNTIVSYPSDRLYNAHHEWIKFENDTTATMGITSYAVQLTGIICSIDEEGDTPIAIHSDSTDLRPPFGHKVSLITGDLGTMDFIIDFESLLYLKNPLVDSDPSVASSDPYYSGWLYKLTVYDTTGGYFMNSNEYANYVNSL